MGRLNKLVFMGCAYSLVLLVGCRSLMPKRFHASINSLAAPDAGQKKNYLLLPGMENVNLDDLQFKEYAAMIDKVLGEKGFRKVEAMSEGDIIIFMSYGVGDPQTYQYSYSVPIWGQTGVTSAQTYGTAYSYGNSTSYSGTTTYAPKYGITGFQPVQGTQTTYTRFLVLKAVDFKKYSESKKLVEVWNTSAASAGASSDLRLVFPYLVVAASPHVGTRTEKAVLETVDEDDISVQDLVGNSR